MKVSVTPLIGQRSHTLMLAFIALTALTAAWHWMAFISSQDPWYRNTDMNVHNLVDALSLNSGYSPHFVDQPAAPTKFLLALDYRIRNELGLLPTWTLKRFARSPNLLREYAPLIQAERVHSRILVMLVIIATAAIIGHVTRRFDLACFGTVLLSGSTGLLFHGLLIRPELLCVGFGSVLALYTIWLAGKAIRPAVHVFWVLLAGMCVGLALLSKLPALYYGAVTFAACCLLPWSPPRERSGTDRTVFPLAALIGLAAGAGLLGLLLLTNPSTEFLSSTALARMRLAAICAALLPLVGLAQPQTMATRFVRARLLDGCVLFAGVIISLLLWHGLLRTVLPAPAASEYLARILNTVFYPDPLFRLYTNPDEQHRFQELGHFFLEMPGLFITTAALTCLVGLSRTVPRQTHVLLGLLMAQGIGMAVLLSKRQFLAQYIVFAQLPFLAIWPIALAALHDRWQATAPASEQRWPVALAISAALTLSISGLLELRPKYRNYQDDKAIPVRDLTVTFLYDNDAHPPAYLAAMKARYPSRQEFTAALNSYLSAPANRH